MRDLKQDLETGQRAFGALRPEEKAAIIDALHGETRPALEILKALVSPPGAAYGSILDIEEAFQREAGYQLDRVVLRILLRSIA